MDKAGLAAVVNITKKNERKTVFMSVAIAVFAKTKTLSPVKTRLANDIGKSLAQEFYTLSVKAVEEIVLETKIQSKNQISPYWALAEKEALDYKEWQVFDRIWTGEGNLGMRLHNVYSSLRKKHDYVVIVGTDSPQLEPSIIIRAICELELKPEFCVIGPALDGGFYLFAAKVCIAEYIWTHVIYSQNNTLIKLASNLNAEGIKIHLLSPQNDVDNVYDLSLIMNDLKTNSNLLPAQKKLYRWLQLHKPFFLKNI